MKLGDLLRETLSVDCDEVWENERTPTPVRVFGVRLHSMGLSLREIVAVLDWLGVDRFHGAVWDWTHTLAENQADPPTARKSGSVCRLYPSVTSRETTRTGRSLRRMTRSVTLPKTNRLTPDRPCELITRRSTSFSSA